MEIVVSLIILVAVFFGFCLGRLPLDSGLNLPTFRLPTIKRNRQAKVTVTHDAYDGPIEPKQKTVDAKDQFADVVRGYQE